MANVKVAHGWTTSGAFTTTRPMTARRNRHDRQHGQLSDEATLVSLTSSRAIWPRDFPSRRIEQKRNDKILYAGPRNAAPAISQSVPGK